MTRQFTIEARGITKSNFYEHEFSGIGLRAALEDFLKGRTFHSLVEFVVIRYELKQRWDLDEEWSPVARKTFRNQLA